VKSVPRKNATEPWWRPGLVVAALGAALVPTPKGLVEELYSARAYLAIQTRMTAASNLVPFALMDALLAIVVGGWLVAAARDLVRGGGGGWLRAGENIAIRTIVVASALYLGFVLLWGLNYRRVPLAEKLQFDADRAGPDAARLLLATSVDWANVLYDAAHSAETVPEASRPGHVQLAAAFARTQHDLGAARVARPGRPKHTLLAIYFRRAAVDGMTDPYFLETLVADELLPFERPFVVAHEWSHLAGYADEGEANFVGWLTCLRGTEADQYSGWLFLYGELLRVVGSADRLEFTSRLAPGPQGDRRAIADRVRRNVNPRLSAAGWRVYDKYLKANRVEAGAASYAGVVRLTLGTRFGTDWTPLRKSER
jgi:hypothetical protein